jgi:hypothetical protein
MSITIEEAGILGSHMGKRENHTQCFMTRHDLIQRLPESSPVQLSL